jgi:hypothetical protein
MLFYLFLFTCNSIQHWIIVLGSMQAQLLEEVYLILS